MFKTLLRRLAEVDAFLRNSTLREDNELVDPDSLFEDDPNDPWYTDVYWFIRRNAERLWEAPGEAYNAVKWFMQRGRRGWADCDTWSLGSYLDAWLPAALRKLKDHPGIPMSMFDGVPTDDETYKIAEAQARWHAIMNKIIAGFEASGRIEEGLYEEELGSYPLRRPEGVSREAWKKVKDDRLTASLLLEARDKKIFEEGMKLFVEHYPSLWD